MFVIEHRIHYLLLQYFFSPYQYMHHRAQFLLPSHHQNLLRFITACIIPFCYYNRIELWQSYGIFDNQQTIL